MVEISFGAKYNQKDVHVIICSHIIFDRWSEIMEKYIAGNLPNLQGELLVKDMKQVKSVTYDKVGEISQAKGTKKLGPTIFRCLLGLEDLMIESLQNDILDGIWLHLSHLPLSLWRKNAGD